MKNVISKISFKAVIIGAIVDVGGTNVWGIILGVYLAVKYHLTADTLNQWQTLLTHDPIAMISGWIVGSGFSIVGGYVAARIAKHDILLNATLASFLCVVFALFAIGSVSVMGILIEIIGNPVLAFLGGYIRLKQLGSRKEGGAR